MQEKNWFDRKLPNRTDRNSNSKGQIFAVIPVSPSQYTYAYFFFLIFRLKREIVCTLCRIFSHTLFINRISKVYQARPEYTMDVIRIRNSQTYVGEKLTDAREKLTRRRKVGLWLIVYEFQIISASRSQRQISRETFDRSGYFGLYICIFYCS